VTVEVETPTQIGNKTKKQFPWNFWSNIIVFNSLFKYWCQLHAFLLICEQLERLRDGKS